MRDQRREERRGERLPGGGNESGLGLGGRAAGAGAYIAQPPTVRSPPQWADPMVTGGAGRGVGGGGCGRAPSGRLRASRAEAVPPRAAASVGPGPC